MTVTVPPICIPAVLVAVGIVLVAGAKDVAGNEVFGGTEAVGAVDVEGLLKGVVDVDVVAGDEAPGA